MLYACQTIAIFPSPPPAHDLDDARLVVQQVYDVGEHLDLISNTNFRITELQHQGSSHPDSLFSAHDHMHGRLFGLALS